MPGELSTTFPTLSEKHAAHLKASAISDEVIIERGYMSVLGKTPLADAGFAKSQQRAPGILIPLHGVDGTIVGHQYRPDNPRMDSARARSIKYENPSGASVRIDCPPRCRPQLGNPGTALWVTEGVKKVDSLASAGCCAIGLTGVWGFKGKNEFGGTTFLADFDSIAFKDRLCYLVFDSDSASNPGVRKALDRLAEHLKRKGGKVRILQLPPGPNGEKVGADDYLAQGGTVDGLIGLERIDKPRESLREKSHEMYCVSEGRICWVKQLERGGEEMVPLCNFTAQVHEQITRDDGAETSTFFRIGGQTGRGDLLMPIEIPAASFAGMGWVVGQWGMKPVIAAGANAKDRLREALQLMSQDALERHVFSHTGWREIDGKMVFLTAAGALGMQDVAVDLEEDLKYYALPARVENPEDALRASWEFTKIGNKDVTLPLWAAMYLAPLSDILDPAFTLFVVGYSGSFKSTVTSLALNHFGPRFDEYHLPAAWRDTENKLEKLLFLAKDLPMVIDDWAPGQDAGKARELEIKAEHVIRAQGNRQGKGRLRSDTSSRRTYVPRGLLLTSGEQLPSGHSHTARIFTVEIEQGDIDRERLTAAQHQRQLYSQAMSQYILWLGGQYKDLQTKLPKMYLTWREEAHAENMHARLAGAVAWLYAGLTLGLTFLQEKGIVTEEEAEETAAMGSEIFVRLCTNQGHRVEDERPGFKFLKILGSLIDQGKAVFWDKNDTSPRKPTPGENMVGWNDIDGHVLLNPPAAYGLVHEHCQRAGDPFTFKENAVWKDLARLGYLSGTNGRSTTTARLYGSVKRVIKLKRVALEGENKKNEPSTQESLL